MCIPAAELREIKKSCTLLCCGGFLSVRVSEFHLHAQLSVAATMVKQIKDKAG
jgi:hypothetical protein